MLHHLSFMDTDDGCAVTYLSTLGCLYPYAGLNKSLLYRALLYPGSNHLHVMADIE